MFRVLRPGGCVVINVAALDMLKGDHSALGGEVRRYTKRELRDEARTGRIPGEAAHLHERVAVSHHSHGARASAPARRESRSRRTKATSTCRPRRSTRCSRARSHSSRRSSRPASTCRSAARCCAWRRNPDLEQEIRGSGEFFSRSSCSAHPVIEFSARRCRSPSVRRSGLPDRSCGTNDWSVSIVSIPSEAASAAAGTFTRQLEVARRLRRRQHLVARADGHVRRRIEIPERRLAGDRQREIAPAPS